jgi:hypothetical protein
MGQRLGMFNELMDKDEFNNTVSGVDEFNDKLLVGKDTLLFERVDRQRKCE